MSRRREAPADPPWKTDSTSAPAVAATAKAIASAIGPLAARGDNLRRPPLVLTVRTRKRFFGIGPRRRGTASRVPFQPHDLTRRRTKSPFSRTGVKTPPGRARALENKSVPFFSPGGDAANRGSSTDAKRPENRIPPRARRTPAKIHPAHDDFRPRPL